MGFNPQKKLKTFFCPHCQSTLGKTAFYRHKRLYYDSRKREWSKLDATNSQIADETTVIDTPTPQDMDLTTTETALLPSLDILGKTWGHLHFTGMMAKHRLTNHTKSY